jgi:peptidoglycan/LPS O-acetylase OafA/YrhL
VIELLPSLGAYPARSPAVHIPYWRVLLAALPAVLLVSAISYWLVERPFQARGKPNPGTPPAGQRPSSLRGRVWGRLDPVWVLLAWAGVLMLFLVLAEWRR